MRNMKTTVESIIEDLDIALAMEPVDQKLALRIAFCLGAIATVGLDDKGRSEAKEWLEQEFELLMMELGS